MTSKKKMLNGLFKKEDGSRKPWYERLKSGFDLNMVNFFTDFFFNESAFEILSRFDDYEYLWNDDVNRLLPVRFHIWHLQTGGGVGAWVTYEEFCELAYDPEAFPIIL